MRCEADIWAFTPHINQCSGETQRRLVARLRNCIIVTCVMMEKSRIGREIENQGMLQSINLTDSYLFLSATAK